MGSAQREIPGAGNRTTGGKIPWKTDKPEEDLLGLAGGEPNPNSPDFARGGRRCVRCLASPAAATVLFSNAS